jgi:hypothetical protein
VDLANSSTKKGLHGSGRSTRRTWGRRQGRGGGGVPFARLRVGGPQGGGGIRPHLLLPPLPLSRPRREHHLAAAAVVGGLEKLPPSPRVWQVLQGCLSIPWAKVFFFLFLSELFICLSSQVRTSRLDSENGMPE